MTAKATLSLVEQLRTAGAAGSIPVAQADGTLVMTAHVPTAHASTHAGAGSDPITSLGALTITGDLTFDAARTVNLFDNNASSLSFDSAGHSGLWVLDTLDAAEQVRVGSSALKANAPTAILNVGKRALTNPAPPTWHVAMAAFSAAEDGVVGSHAVYARAHTDGTSAGYGLFAFGGVNSTNDTATAYGAVCWALQPHVGGENVALYVSAASGTNNYALRTNGGNVQSLNPITWYIGNNDAAGFTFSADDGGTADIFVVNTTTGTEGVHVGPSTTKLWSDADGTLLLANAAATQGIKLDTATTDGTLILTDEAGSAANLGIAGLSATGVLTSTFGGGGAISLNAEAYIGRFDDDLRIWTTERGGAGIPSGAISLFSGEQTNVGNVASGSLSLYTGDTTTDGDTGNVNIYTGAAGAGAADAGDIVLSTHGTVVGFQVKGSDGLCYMGTAAQGVNFNTVTDGELHLFEQDGTTWLSKLGSIAALEFGQIGSLANLSRGTLAFNANAGNLTIIGAGSDMQMFTANTGGTTETGYAAVFTGNNTNAASGDSGPARVYTGTANAGNSGLAQIYTGASTAGTTGDVLAYSGVATAGQANAGDVVLGVHGDPTGAGVEAMRIKGADGLVYMGTAAQGVKFDTSVDSVLTLTTEAPGNLSVAASTFVLDTGGTQGSLTRGVLSFNSGTGKVTNNTAGAAMSFESINTGGALATGNVNIYSGANSNAGDQDSGNVSIYTGTTNTDGDTGDVLIYTGVAGAGATDAGDIILSTHGTVQGFQVKGADGMCYMGTAAQGIKFDTSSNGVLLVTDEAGAAASVQLNTGSFKPNASAYFNQNTLSFGGATSATVVNTVNSYALNVKTQTHGSGGTGTGDLNLFTGDQSNAGVDLPSGDVNLYTGTTNTDGDTGNVNITTGAAGAGAADAGDIVLTTHGTVVGLQVKGTDGLVYIGTAAQAVGFDATTTDGWLRITDEAGAAVGLEFGSADYRISAAASELLMEVGEGLQVELTQDSDANNNAMIHGIMQSGVDFTGSSGMTQFGMRLNPDVAQTGTAAFKAISVEVDATSQGSGQDYLLFLDWGDDGTPQFAVTDTGDVTIAGIHSYTGHAYVYENTTAQAVTESGSWNFVYTSGEWITGDVMNGVTYQDGATATITAYADQGGGLVRATTGAAHGLSVGEFVSLTDNTNYLGVFEIIAVSDTTHFDFTDTWAGDDAQGEVTRSGNLTFTNAGTYVIAYSMSLAPGAINTSFETVLFVNEDAQGETEMEAEARGSGKFTGYSGTTVHDVTAGDVVSVGFKNKTNTADATIRYCNIRAWQV